MEEEQKKEIEDACAASDQTILSFDELRELKSAECGRPLIVKITPGSSARRDIDEDDYFDEDIDLLSPCDDDADDFFGVGDSLRSEVSEPPPEYGPYDDAAAIALFNAGKYCELRNCNRFILGTWAAVYYRSLCLERGFGGINVPSTMKDAVPLIKDEIFAAAGRGDVDAINALGIIYECGYGVEKDVKTAFSWYEKGAEKGFKKAKCNLARCYAHGIGVTRSPDVAFRLYCELGEEGDAISQYNAASMALRGEGVDMNPDLAVYWLKKAAASGNVDAVKIIAACGTDLSVQRIAVEALLYRPPAQANVQKDDSGFSFCVTVPPEFNRPKPDGKSREDSTPHDDAWILKSAPDGAAVPPAATRAAVKIPDLLRANPSFAALLIKYVRDRFDGDAPYVYRSAGISRKTYSSIVGNELRPVSKRTAIAFAFALRLSELEFSLFIKSAGYSLSDSLLEDMIFTACLRAGIYSLAKISQILEAHGASPFELQKKEEEE